MRILANFQKKVGKENYGSECFNVTLEATSEFNNVAGVADYLFHQAREAVERQIAGTATAAETPACALPAGGTEPKEQTGKQSGDKTGETTEGAENRPARLRGRKPKRVDGASETISGLPERGNTVGGGAETTGGQPERGNPTGAGEQFGRLKQSRNGEKGNQGVGRRRLPGLFFL